MLRKVTVSVFVLGVAAFGCSSNSGDDTTGKGGGSASAGRGGSNAGGGAGGASAGSGGSSAGAGGASAGGTAGGASAGKGGTSAGGTAGGASAGSGGASVGGAGGGVLVMENCTVTTSNATAGLTAQTFCENYLPNCGTAVTGYTNMGTCVASYMAATATQQACRSYHLCWGVEGKTSSAGGAGGAGGSAPNPTTHCPHTVGTGACNL